MKKYIYSVQILVLVFGALVAASSLGNALTDENLMLSNQVLNNYKADNIVQEKDKITITASYTGKDQYWGKPTSPISRKLKITIQFYDDKHLQIHIVSLDDPQWEMPQAEPYPRNHKITGTTINKEYEVFVDKQPLNFVVRRRSTQEIIFNTKVNTFVVTRYFHEIGTSLPTNRIFGLGGRATKFLLKNGIYTMWTKDAPVQIDRGQGGQQTYGAHPVYMVQEKSKKFHIVYLRTTAAADFIIEQGKIFYRLVGGALNFLIWLGNESPEDTLKLYHRYIDGHLIQPFWSFGFHISRYGWLNLDQIMTVGRKFKENDLPVDTIWSDIDYMENYQDFTLDAKRYPPQKFANFLQENKLRFVPIIDAGIAIGDNEAYRDGIKKDVFIKNSQGKNLIGKVWPGFTHFVDFAHPNALAYWQNQLKAFRDIIPYSGIWLDMNEIASFCNGECRPNEYTPSSGDEQLPYQPGGQLSSKTISINGKHYGDVLELHYHNINGFLQTAATRKALENLGLKDGFILSRSNSVGSGKYGALWFGDNAASYEFMQLSIPQAFAFNIYGIPFAGADICGFDWDTTEELCARWMQLGSFFPFARNHNYINKRDQEPYALGETVLVTSRLALKARYSILKWYYSLFVALGGAGTVFRPLMWQYPKDDQVYDEKILNTQLLISDVLMITPVLEQGKTDVWPYFPQDKWYNFNDGLKVASSSDKPKWYQIRAPLREVLPIFMRGGTILYNQSTEGVTRVGHLNNKFNLVVALSDQQNDNKFRANGKILTIQNYEDYETIKKCTAQQNCLLNINAEATIEQNALLLKIKFDSKVSVTVQETIISKIYVYGVRIDKLKASGSYKPYTNSVAQVKSNGGSSASVTFEAKVKTKYQLNSDEAVVTFDVERGFKVENQKEYLFTYKFY